MDREPLRLTGEINMDTVPALYAQGMAQLGSGDLVVDWSQAKAVDSAAVGLLLAWQREAQRGQRNLQTLNLPDNLRSLARLYGVETFLSK